jgi:hypothetical protein
MELLSTITNLKAALERAMASSTPTSKYMQVRRVLSVYVCLALVQRL